MHVYVFMPLLVWIVFVLIRMLTHKSYQIMCDPAKGYTISMTEIFQLMKMGIRSYFELQLQQLPFFLRCSSINFVIMPRF